MVTFFVGFNSVVLNSLDLLLLVWLLSSLVGCIVNMILIVLWLGLLFVCFWFGV